MHLKQIDEGDDELFLIDDLGAEHEESSSLDEEDEFLIVEKRPY